ncbi:replication initiation protein [Sporomusa malonica]|uniref:Initiator Replication protein n=1 Tax=Sporomusa malonica TaxID=112901 RepID=A0A1W1YML9_9FIRM|nr:replication initiation protein [Sporomusa malonica]SMC37490.1 Initiator Replication protein [Sporomusa malonica]
MEVDLAKNNIILDLSKLLAEALYPGGQEAKANQLIKVGSIIGRRDPLTEFQQKAIIGAISFFYKNVGSNANVTTYVMEFSELLKLCDSKQEDMGSYLINEIEKLEKKGVWLYDKVAKKLTRTLWFQSIEFTDREVAFHFTEKIIPIILEFAPMDAELQLVKGLRYKGKHTLSVFEIIWKWRNQGVVEYSISDIMRQLSLEQTRYSYGQLRLRVIEPSIEEIYAWDDAVFVRFGPTFSGRRVEGVWFEVKTGEEAKTLRKQHPEFKFSAQEDR